MTRNQQDPAQAEAVATLCHRCGLCCNGVLFRDVRLTKADPAKVLDLAGLNLRRNGRTVVFDQPCSCFDGRHCSVYSQRPVRCRQFDCHTLKQLAEGRIRRSVALARIRRAKRGVDKVLGLLRELGQLEESLPLAERYQRVMNESIDLSRDGRSASRRGVLLVEVGRLMDRLHRDFLASKH